MPTLQIPAGGSNFENFNLSHNFKNLVEAPDFLDIHTKIFRMTYN